MAHVNNINVINVRKISTIKSHTSSEIPAPRSGHRCVADNRNLYVFGGFSPFHDEFVFRELWRYNIATRLWKRLCTNGPFPNEVCSSCVLLDKGCIITYGGSGVPFGRSNSNKLHVYIINENKWIEVDAVSNNDDSNQRLDDEDVENLPHGDVLRLHFGMPVPAYGQSMVLSPDKDLYIFAGTSGIEFFSYLTRFSFNTKMWDYIPHNQPPHISPRYRHEAITYGDRFYIIGGGMGGARPSDVCKLEEVPSFCYSSKTWEIHKCIPSEMKGFPNNRRCHGCVLFQDKVYICGGYDGITMFDDVWTLDMLTFKWTKLPKILPYPVYFHSTAITPSGCMLTFGGVKSMDPENDPRSNDLHCLWLTIPPLLDLCLQAVYSCIPDIDSISNEELLEIGIPEHLIPSKNSDAATHCQSLRGQNGYTVG